jgi:hypothetical protein
VEMRDFSHTSLVHSFGEKFFKLLASHQGPRTPDIVAINQSALIRGRSILENFMLIQSAIRALHGKIISEYLLKNNSC